MNNLVLIDDFALRPVLTSERIRFREREPFVVIFSCQRHEIIDGIEVIPVSPFVHGKSLKPAVEDTRYFGKVEVDFDSLFACCTVDRINIRAVSKDFCEVCIDCTATCKGNGFDGWSDRYEDFARSTLFSVWASALFTRNDDCASMRLREPCSANDIETKLSFAIAPLATR